jgi:hypothetical protein
MYAPASDDGSVLPPRRLSHRPEQAFSAVGIVRMQARSARRHERFRN